MIPLGIFAWFGTPVPFQERVKMIKDAGFDATSVWWEEDDDERRRLRHLAPRLVRGAGLALDNIHVPYRGCSALWSHTLEVRRAAVNRHISWVRDCAEHTVPVMVMHVTGGTAASGANPHGIDSLRRILEVAEDLGVTVGLENTRGPERVGVLLDALDSPFLGLCYDVSHDWLWHDSPCELLRTWGRRLVAAHIGDTDGVLDRHWVPGEGAIDFARPARTFDWETFRGTLMFEVVPRDKAENPARFLSRAYTAAQGVRRLFQG